MLLLQWLKGKKRIVFLSLTLVTILLIIVVMFVVYILKMKCFYKGISIDGLDISGLSFLEARAHVEELVNQKYENWAVVLEYSGNAWSINSADIDLTMKYDDALEKAYKIGRIGNYLNRLLEIYNIRSKKINIESEINFNGEKLKNILIEIRKEIDRKEENSQIVYNGKEIIIDRHTIGLAIDVDKNIKLIENHILEKLNNIILLIVQESVPDITYDSIKEIKYIMSSFSTVFNPYDTNRAHNIKLSCEKISGIIIMPGEIFSMNRALGERIVENGYKEAPVILRNKFVQEVGGGICQVSTTLYVTAIKAGIEIIERQPHSMPLGYVKPGQDATIAGDAIDLKLQNNLGYPICLWSEVHGNILKVMILGNQSEDDYLIKLRSEVLEEYYPDVEEVLIDDSLEDGVIIVTQEARKGLKVAVYKEVYSKSGELLDKEKVSEDTYRPVRAQIKVNSKYFSQQHNEEEMNNEKVGD